MWLQCWLVVIWFDFEILKYCLLAPPPVSFTKVCGITLRCCCGGGSSEVWVRLWCIWVTPSLEIVSPLSAMMFGADRGWAGCAISCSENFENSQTLGCCRGAGRRWTGCCEAATVLFLGKDISLRLTLDSLRKWCNIWYVFFVFFSFYCVFVILYLFSFVFFYNF